MVSYISKFLCWSPTLLSPILPIKPVSSQEGMRHTVESGFIEAGLEGVPTPLNMSPLSKVRTEPLLSRINMFPMFPSRFMKNNTPRVGVE